MMTWGMYTHYVPLTVWLTNEFHKGKNQRMIVLLFILFLEEEKVYSVACKLYWLQRIGSNGSCKCNFCQAFVIS